MKNRLSRCFATEDDFSPFCSMLTGNIDDDYDHEMMEESVMKTRRIQRSCSRSLRTLIDGAKYFRFLKLTIGFLSSNSNDETVRERKKEFDGYFQYASR
jgi:hypothetical protein